MNTFPRVTYSLILSTSDTLSWWGHHMHEDDFMFTLVIPLFLSTILLLLCHLHICPWMRNAKIIRQHPIPRPCTHFPISSASSRNPSQPPSSYQNPQEILVTLRDTSPPPSPRAKPTPSGPFRIPRAPPVGPQVYIAARWMRWVTGSSSAPSMAAREYRSSWGKIYNR